MSKTKTKKEALEDRLGRVLGRSWADLGPILGGLGAQNRAVAHTGLEILKNQLLGKIKLQDGSWAHLGSIWVDLGRPRGVRMRAAEGQKWSYVEMIWSSEVEVKLRCDLGWKKRMPGSRDWTLQGRRWGDQERPKSPPRPTQEPPRSPQDGPRAPQDLTTYDLRCTA